MVIIHFINLTYQSQFDLEVSAADMSDIKQLKKLISKKEETSSNTLQIIYGGQIICDNASLKQLALKAGETIQLIIKLKIIPALTFFQRAIRVMHTTTQSLERQIKSKSPKVIAQFVRGANTQLIQDTLDSYPFIREMAAAHPELEAIFKDPKKLQRELSKMNHESVAQDMIKSEHPLSYLPPKTPARALTNIEQSIYGYQLQKLRQIGFNNEQKNMRLLKQNNGDLQATTLRLMNF